MEQEPKKEKSPIARKVKWWFLLTAGTVACFILSLVSIISDWKDLFFVFIFLGAFLIFLQGIFLFIALFTRQWGHAIGILVSILASVVVGFLCIILTAVGQHHPPKHIDDDMVMEDSLEVVTDTIVP